MLYRIRKYSFFYFNKALPIMLSCICFSAISDCGLVYEKFASRYKKIYDKQHYLLSSETSHLHMPWSDPQTTRFLNEILSDIQMNDKDKKTLNSLRIESLALLLMISDHFNLLCEKDIPIKDSELSKKAPKIFSAITHFHPSEFQKHNQIDPTLRSVFDEKRNFAEVQDGATFFMRALNQLIEGMPHILSFDAISILFDGFFRGINSYPPSTPLFNGPLK